MASLRWLGLLHPLAVHFPITLLLAAALFEGVGAVRGAERFRSAARLCLGLGALAAVAAAALGWLDAAGTGVEPALRPVLAWHRWLGTGVAAAAGAAWALRNRRGYRAVLFLAAALTVAAGHLGGTLVYGTGYFSHP